MSRGVIKWPSVSSIGPPRHRMARGVVKWPSVSSIGPPRHRMARGVVVWFTGLSIGPLCRRFVRGVVDSLAVLSTGPLGCRLTRCAVDCPLCCRFAHWVVNLPGLWLICLLSRRLTCRVVVRPFAAARVTVAAPSCVLRHCRRFVLVPLCPVLTCHW